MLAALRCLLRGHVQGDSTAKGRRGRGEVPDPGVGHLRLPQHAPARHSDHVDRVVRQPAVEGSKRGHAEDLKKT